MPKARRTDPAASSLVDTLVDKIRQTLLAWYDAHARPLPWRAKPGSDIDPYRVWLSEVMLQQTTTVTVAPYFAGFLAAYPTVEALAAAPREDVLRLWAGLGYYSRARNLHAAAQAVAEAGGFSSDEATLRALPGVGAYTAAAIAAIAFDRPTVPVDGNIERVMSRLHAVASPLPSAKPALRTLAQTYARSDRPGDFAQALMDLGSAICTPRRPKCGDCPIAFGCAAYAEGKPETYPRKTERPAKPVRYGTAFVALRERKVLIVTRPETGLLAGMRALPTSPWESEPKAHDSPPFAGAWKEVGEVRHTFTHFHLRLSVQRADMNLQGPTAEESWKPVDKIENLGLPTVFAKALRLALAE